MVWIYIDKHGVKCHPRRLSALKDGHEPVTASELSQFVNCLQWMCNFIPDFSQRVAPLREILEEAYALSGKRTSKSIKSIRLTFLGWNDKYIKAFWDLIQQLREAVKLAHRDHSKSLCIYPDASDENWAAVVTQCDPTDLDLPKNEQKHQPLAFLGNSFNNTQKNWTTFEKEAYAIFQTFERLDYMFTCEENIHVYTDHRNLLFVFHPLSLKPSLGRHIINKVHRWALYLSQFSYTIEHVEGENNVAADMLTRWYAGCRGKRPSARRILSKLKNSDLIPTPEEKDFLWPTKHEIIETQRQSKTKPSNLSNTDDGLFKINGKIWIPSENADLQLRLFVIAHCGSAGHRSIDSTLNSLKEGYTWDNIDDAKHFVKNCLHCTIAKAGMRVPRPLSSTLHATKPNEIIHLDFLYMGPGYNDLKYILVIRDDLSGYIWLCPTQPADASSTAKELLKWIHSFTPMETWISDQGSHFKNQVMQELANEHRIHHQFSVAYSPWINGTVEICMRHVRAACTALLSEFHLGPQDWPSIIGTVMSALNATPSKRLGKNEKGNYRTPLEVFTGFTPSRNILFVENSITKDNLKIDQIRAQQILKIDEMQVSLDNMHKDVGKRVANARKKQIAHHNKKTNIISHQFNIGDFVLIRTAQDRSHKLSFRWRGPQRISRIIGDAVYEVENLFNGEVDTVHASRIILYRDDLNGKQPSEKLMRQLQHVES